MEEASSSEVVVAAHHDMGDEWQRNMWPQASYLFITRCAYDARSSGSRGERFFRVRIPIVFSEISLIDMLSRASSAALGGKVYPWCLRSLLLLWSCHLCLLRVLCLS
ncbi:hypothetical protein CDAR_371501 [Caerostris darwini]|uniref:Uncharacterized protein n=1 Tax=Caerostris darwini TaxID=1538125 RepID=A0AAV4X7R1_9ARAC|nr:hypothetical protein CDAR_371501 [Caerostris darwini]